MEFALELQTLLTQMETDSDETINKIRDTVWAVNSENDSLYILIVKTHIFARHILDNKVINLFFENNIVTNKSMLDFEWLLENEAIIAFFFPNKEPKLNIFHFEITNSTLIFFTIK